MIKEDIISKIKVSLDAHPDDTEVNLELDEFCIYIENYINQFLPEKVFVLGFAKVEQNDSINALVEVCKFNIVLSLEKLLSSKEILVNHFVENLNLTIFHFQSDINNLKNFLNKF